MTVFPAGHILTSEDFDTLFPDGVGAGSSYVPTFTQGATLTKSVNLAAYHRIGRRVLGNVDMTASSAGTASNLVLVGLPVPAVQTFVIGTAFLYDASVGFLQGALVYNTATTAKIVLNGGTQYLGLTGSGSTAAIASGDIASYEFNYLAAS